MSAGKRQFVEFNQGSPNVCGVCVGGALAVQLAMQDVDADAVMCDGMFNSAEGVEGIHGKTKTGLNRLGFRRRVIADFEIGEFPEHTIDGLFWPAPD